MIETQDENTHVPDHEFVPVAGHPDDDECTYRSDGTDATYCGEPRERHEPPRPLDERLLYALMDAGLDETDAAAALEAVLGTLSTHDQWQAVCSHGATAVGTEERARAVAANFGPNCTYTSVRTRRVIEFQALDDWRQVAFPPGSRSGE